MTHRETRGQHEVGGHLSKIALWGQKSLSEVRNASIRFSTPDTEKPTCRQALFPKASSPLSTQSHTPAPPTPSCVSAHRSGGVDSGENPQVPDYFCDGELWPFSVHWDDKKMRKWKMTPTVINSKPSNTNHHPLFQNYGFPTFLVMGSPPICENQQ